MEFSSSRPCDDGLPKRVAGGGLLQRPVRHARGPTTRTVHRPINGSAIRSI
jgi:hypothetical protein